MGGVPGTVVVVWFVGVSARAGFWRALGRVVGVVLCCGLAWLGFGLRLVVCGVWCECFRSTVPLLERFSEALDGSRLHHRRPRVNTSRPPHLHCCFDT